MLCDLNWSTLQHHREVSRLKTFHNVIYNTSCSPQNATLFRDHYLCHTPPRTSFYKYSYFPRTVRDWNNLPIQTIESSSLQLFLTNLTN